MTFPNTPQSASADNNNAANSSRKLHPLVDLQCDRTWFDELQNRITKGGPWDDWTLFQLALEAEQAKRIESFEQLLCLRSLPSFEPMAHQISTARKVVHEMGGRAILADEVGLGKTIEAGLVLKEYMVRGLAKRVLILVPASLVLQWVRELNQKFGISAVAQKKSHTWGYDVVVASCLKPTMT
jgi:SNF2 family DNA or RNA helicase